METALSTLKPVMAHLTVKTSLMRNNPTAPIVCVKRAIDGVLTADVWDMDPGVTVRTTAETIQTSSSATPLCARPISSSAGTAAASPTPANVIRKWTVMMPVMR